MKAKRVKFPELKEILKKHRLIHKYKKINKETGHKTTYYILTKKTTEEKCEELREMKPFEENNVL